jgi:glutathione-regulated potassium-efflux system ancillary protein KefC
VLLLFLIGLELDSRRLWAMRRPLLGIGGLQVAVTAVLISGTAAALGLDWRAALVMGMGLALSSTAVALQTLTERNLLGTPAGKTGFAVLLFQDLAVIPMLALLPLLGTGATQAGPGWAGAAEGLAAIVAVVVGGRFLTRPLFRFIAAARLQEVFTAFSLLIVAGIAYLMREVGLSMALGAFLAGVLLAESEYRRAIETDIEPFKGLLMGLFFTAVGMAVDFSFLVDHPLLALGGLIGLLGLKMAVLGVLARLEGLPRQQWTLFAVLLSQGGELAFVLFAAAAGVGALPPDLRETLVVLVTLSMLATPLLLAIHERWGSRRLPAAPPPRAADAIDEENPVIIAGFGRFGQIVARLLHANGIATTVLDHDPEHIETVRRFGFKVFYGDATRLDLLRAAGAERAKLLVIAVDDRARSLEMVELARRHFPNLTVLARAWDLVHAFDLRERGVPQPERESFEGALRLGEAALRALGAGAYQAKQAAHRFRAHDERSNERLYGLYHEDVTRRMGVAAEARRELEALFEADERALRESRDQEWQ